MTSFLEDLIAGLERQKAQIWPRRAMRWTWRLVCYRIPKWPNQARTAVICGHQRLVRSWDVRSVWGLDHWLGRVLGAQLVRMADIAHGWPGDYEGGFDQWVADLRTHGEALKHYARANDDLKYHLSLTREDQEDIDHGARTAMHWVAENFSALWD